jgi:outer membrane protein TolC
MRLRACDLVLALAFLPALGCSHGIDSLPQDLAGRILLPPEVEAASRQPAPPAALPSPAEQIPPPQPDPSPAQPASPAFAGPDLAPLPGCRCLTVAEAIELAFRLQPRLRVFLESVEEAQGRQEIAFAPFLPLLSTNYTAGAFELKTGGAGLPLPNLPVPSAFLPLAGAVPLGLDIQTGYTLADVRLQWLLCDFGRRLGRYRQAELAVDIAHLQAQRAYQTVANEVAVGYYQLLRARALRLIAQEAVRRSEEDLGVTRKLAKEGVFEREKVLRAQAALAQVQRLLDLAENAQATALLTLNLAIGLNVASPTCPCDVQGPPAFALCLADCLHQAVEQRREFQVARQTILAAQEAAHVARADFAPRIVGEGTLFDFQQASPRAHLDTPIGFVRLEWSLFEGGKRLAELRVQDARVRTALAQADVISDTIAFQVNEAYHLLLTARKGIERARPQVEAAQEAYRLIRARFQQGDATPAEIIDAETALTRAQQEQMNAIYDVFIALARLEYAMGTNPAHSQPASPVSVVESR